MHAFNARSVHRNLQLQRYSFLENGMIPLFSSNLAESNSIQQSGGPVQSSARVISQFLLCGHRGKTHQRQDQNHNQIVPSICTPARAYLYSTARLRDRSDITCSAQASRRYIRRDCRLHRRIQPVPLCDSLACPPRCRWKPPAMCFQSPWRSLSLLSRLVRQDKLRTAPARFSDSVWFIASPPTLSV